MIEAIKARRSVRTYSDRTLDDKVKAQLMDFAETIENPLGIPVEFRMLDGKEHGLKCPVVTGTDLYVGGKVRKGPDANLAFGYSFEAFILYAQSLGLGTVWLGGTMNRGAFESAMELGPDEMMPCATPVGYGAETMSIREKMMRAGIKADQRKLFGELFFHENFDTPLTKEKAGQLLQPLEMVRLAPSAVNRQPWRVILRDNYVHFFLKRDVGAGRDDKLDMQMVDMGIALCHFHLAAKECGINAEFCRGDFRNLSERMEYIGSFKLKG